MKVPFLRDLLRSDSIKIESNITFSNLDPLSTYLGRPGEREEGRAGARRIPAPAGAAPDRRDRGAAAMCPISSSAPSGSMATPRLHRRYRRLADRGGRPGRCRGSGDQGARRAARCCSTSAAPSGDAAELVRRFRHSPKPMYYQPPFLVAEMGGVQGAERDRQSDDERRSRRRSGAWGFEALLTDRLPRYQQLADKFGYTVEAADLATVARRRRVPRPRRRAIGSECDSGR